MRRVLDWRACWGLGWPAAGALALALALVLACGSQTARAGDSPAQPVPQASAQARQLLHWIRVSRDNMDRPFVVIDKRRARAFAFAADGLLHGWAPVLVGAARADHSVPGIGERPMSRVEPQDRTTPAGRFEAEIGRNLEGEDVLWVDYEAAVSLHRVRARNPSERRLQRLASATPHDNRISYGCINVPQAFFDQVVLPLLGPSAGRAVVYVLPEVLPFDAVFPQASAARAQATSVAQGPGRFRAWPAAR